MYKSTLKDNVKVLQIIKGHPEGENTLTDGNGWHILLSKEALDTVKPDLPEGLQVPKKSNKEGLLTSTELVTEQANDLHCREAGNTVVKQVSL